MRKLYKKRHLSLFFALLIFLAMWMFYGWNSWNGDRAGYELYYHSRDTLSSWGGEFGYGYLNILASRSGISYQLFQIIIAFSTLALVFRYVAKRTISPLSSIIVYAICFFSLDFVLMRNFLAFAIVLQGMIYLFNAKLLARFCYMLCVLLATTIHQSSLAFIIFAFMPVQRVVRLDRFFVGLFLFVSTYVVMRSNFTLPAGVAQHFDYYSTSLKSSIANASVHMISVVLITMVVLGERKNLCVMPVLDERGRELIFVLNLNIFSLFFLILYFESEIFVRILRGLLFFNMLHCVNSLFVPKRFYLFSIIYLLVFSGYLIFFFLVPFSSVSFFPMLKNNLIFQ